MGALEEAAVADVASIDAAGDRHRLLNRWQHGFPLVPRPFDALGDACGVAGNAVRAVIATGLALGEVSRLGAVFGTGAGGAGLLAAMQVPPARLDEVAAIVNREPAVTHNYAREHEVNLWFVVTAADAAAVDGTLGRIESATGLPALRLPMQRPYRVALGFDLFDGAAPTAATCRPRDTQSTLDAASPLPLAGEGQGEGRDVERHGGRTRFARGPHRPAAPRPIPPALRPLASRLESGLPLVDHPYRALAEATGLDESAVLRVLRDWCADGTVRRLGVVLRHHEFGIAANAMTVFAPPAHAIDAAGDRLARQPGVTLCYRRAAAPGWPYTLYAMVHGRERDAVREAVERIAEAAGLADVPRAVLFSTRRFKQTGSRWFGSA